MCKNDIRSPPPKTQPKWSNELEGIIHEFIDEFGAAERKRREVLLKSLKKVVCDHKEHRAVAEFTVPVIQNRLLEALDVLVTQLPSAEVFDEMGYCVVRHGGAAAGFASVRERGLPALFLVPSFF